MSTYLSALGLTLVVEVSVYAVLLGALGWSARGMVGNRVRAWAGRVLVGIAVNLLTHPPLWFLLRWGYRHGPDGVWLGTGEAIVVVGEAVLALLACRRGRGDLGWALLVSLAANAMSLAVGLALGG